jgi:hypothetical protein
MSRFLRSIDWQRHGLTIARLALRGSGWVLTHGGRLLERGGETLSDIAEMARAKSLNKHN